MIVVEVRAPAEVATPMVAVAMVVAVAVAAAAAAAAGAAVAFEEVEEAAGVLALNRFGARRLVNASVQSRSRTHSASFGLLTICWALALLVALAVLDSSGLPLNVAAG
jgi:hypothetical protein